MSHRGASNSSPGKRLLRCLPVFVLALAACGGDDDGSDAVGQDLPARFEGGFFELVGEPGPDGVALETTLKADNGTSALLTLNVTAPPPEEAPGGSASVECGGTTVEGPFVQEAAGGDGMLEIDGVGSAHLTIEDNRAVAPAREAPPLCTEHVGRWKGMSGDLDGRTGTFVTFGRHTDEVQEATLTLNES